MDDPLSDPAKPTPAAKAAPAGQTVAPAPDKTDPLADPAQP
jgi:hypothetical protein